MLVIEKSSAIYSLQEENRKLKDKLASDFEIEELANLKKTIQFMEDEHKEDVQMKTYLLTYDFIDSARFFSYLSVFMTLLPGFMFIDAQFLGKKSKS
jgi:hypothetical protein